MERNINHRKVLGLRIVDIQFKMRKKKQCKKKQTCHN